MAVDALTSQDITLAALEAAGGLLVSPAPSVDALTAWDVRLPAIAASYPVLDAGSRSKGIVATITTTPIESGYTVAPVPLDRMVKLDGMRSVVTWKSGKQEMYNVTGTFRFSTRTLYRTSMQIILSGAPVNIKLPTGETFDASADWPEHICWIDPASLMASLPDETTVHVNMTMLAVPRKLLGDN